MTLNPHMSKCLRAEPGPKGVFRFVFLPLGPTVFAPWIRFSVRNLLGVLVGKYGPSRASGCDRELSILAQSVS